MGSSLLEKESQSDKNVAECDKIDIYCLIENVQPSTPNPQSLNPYNGNHNGAS